MDDESKKLLRLLIDAQKEQTELLRKHVLPLWTRIRFSLLALFVLMTLVATGVGFTVLAVKATNTSTTAPQATAVLRMAPTNAGTIQLWSAPTSAGTTSAFELRAGKEVPTLASPAVSP
jgi:hypothetical protein